MPYVLVVTEDKELGAFLPAQLRSNGFSECAVCSPPGITQHLQYLQPDVVIVQEITEKLEIAPVIRRRYPNLPIILLVPENTRPGAIATMLTQVSECFKLPLVLDHLISAIRRAITGRDRDNPVKSEPTHHSNFPVMIGETPAFQELKQRVAKVAQTDACVLITGETGTGKELVAARIHHNSRRRMQPLVCINCAAVPEHLVESELFGYERGAFTGAHTAKEGLLQVAHRGTIFLDEIGDMSPNAQAKILRAIETRGIQRLGGKTTLPVDIRIITATNQDLERLTAQGKFRRDLFFRLDVVRIHLPPLRERRADIPLLVEHFMQDLNSRFGWNDPGIDSDALYALKSYDWPGNIRELRNVLEGIYSTSEPKRIGVSELPERVRLCAPVRRQIHRDERNRLLCALTCSNGNKTRAAHELSWSRMTLYRKMAKYRIRSNDLALGIEKLELNGLDRAVVQCD